MKKIFMFVLCCLMVAPAWAATTNSKMCGRGAGVTLFLSARQNGNNNEFVYTSENAYNTIRECAKQTTLDNKTCSVPSGDVVYECDRKTGCDGGTYLMAGSGWILGRKEFKGNGGPQNVSNLILLCNTSGADDMWKPIDYSDCDKDIGTSNRWKEIKFSNSSNKQCYYDGLNYCCKNKSTTTDGGTVTPPVPDDSDKKDYCENSGGYWNGYACECDREKKGLVPDGRNSSDPHLKCKCADSKAKYNKKQDKCVAPTPAQPTPSNGNNNGGGSQTQSGGNNGGNGTVVTPPAGGNGGVNIELQQYECPEPVNGYLYWRAQYKDCEDVIAGLNELEEYCKSGDRTESGYNSRIAGLEKLRDQCKEEAARNQRITRSTAIISDASKKLDDIKAGLKISVWKTAEGNFNGARLASDSIAGVVLGTAGGLITSHLVKKGQVKNGFEDVQCTVGGQKVADWGDEFTVGIR